MKKKPIKEERVPSLKEIKEEIASLNEERNRLQNVCTIDEE